jgi:GWxTD domain-containing protein
MRRSICLLLLALICLGFGNALTFSSPPAEKSSDKKKSQSGDQSKYYKRWIEEDVNYIISDEERSVFKALKSEEERESFIEQFWIRRNPDPRSPYNSFKEEHYRRIAYANAHFTSGVQGWRTDRGRTYIVYGKPDEIETHPTGGSYYRTTSEGGGSTQTYAWEKWWYRHIDNVGDDISLEFVDPSATGEYRLAMSPDEKDALLNVPNAGQTTAEEMGLADKRDRPYFNPTAAIPGNPQVAGMRAKDSPFNRMEIYFNVQRPPKIKFEDLKTVVTSRVSYNSLPYNVRTDFIRLSADKVLVPITMEISNKNLEFKRELNVNRASVNVYGMVTNLSGRIMWEFEDVIASEFSDESFEAGKNKRSEYQKIISLPPGQRYKLDLVLKDVNSKNIGPKSMGITTPKYEEGLFHSSSIILANSISQAPAASEQLEQYVLGDLKIVPNVRTEYLPEQNLIPYMQVYNAAIDQTTSKPSIEVTYSIKFGGKLVAQLKDLSGASIQLFSGERIVLIGRIPLRVTEAGKYTLEIEVLDNIMNRSLTTSTDFTVIEPAKPIVAASPK